MNNITKRELIKILRSIFILGLLGAMLIVGLYVSPGQTLLSHLVVSISILLICGYIIAATHRIIVKNRWKLLTFGMLYIAGVIVYARLVLPNPVADVLSPINNTLSIFFPSRGGYDEAFANDTIFQIIHLLAYLMFAMIVFSWFGRRIINRMWYLFIPKRLKNVFWEYSEGGIILAKDILSRTAMQQIVFVLPASIKNNEEYEKEIFERIDEIGGIVLYRDFDAIKKVPLAHRHFFLSEDQDINIRMALKAADQHASSLYVRTEMPQAWTLFKSAKAEPHIFNQSDLTARKFAKDYPMLDIVPAEKINHLKVDFHFNVLMLGFGWTGREVLHKEICDSQFVGSKFSATIFDNDFQTKNGHYALLYDECISNYDLTFNPKISPDGDNNTVGSKYFYDWVQDNFSKYNRVIISLGDDNINLETALTISQIVKQSCPGFDTTQIFAHVREPLKYQHYANNSYPVIVFGELNEIYTMDVVIAEQLDLMAKVVNYIYYCGNIDTIEKSQIEKNAEQCWQDTVNIFHRDSSRAAAANINNVMKLAGGAAQFSKLVQNAEQLELFAQTEHLRWNAFHFTKGIKKWNRVSQNPKMGAKLYSVENDKNSSLLKHACLVDFVSLEHVSGLVNQVAADHGITSCEDFQETDRRIVRHYETITSITSLSPHGIRKCNQKRRWFMANGQKNSHQADQMKYIPSPRQTSDIVLGDGLTELTEQMAHNVHEVWAKGRIAEGWRWGVRRNDSKKTHPCLVEYEKLPESEREYDRQTAIETLKFIMSSGYDIKPNK